MSSQGPEAKIVKACIKAIMEDPRPSLARKVHGSRYTVGEPDIDAVVAGRSLKVEVKVPGREPTGIQALTLRQWAEAGAVTACVHSVDEMRQVLRSF